MNTTPSAAPGVAVEHWAIDKSTGKDILVYKNCSVIQDEQAHEALNALRTALLAGAAGGEPVAWLAEQYAPTGCESDFDDGEYRTVAAAPSPAAPGNGEVVRVGEHNGGPYDTSSFRGEGGK